MSGESREEEAVLLLRLETDTFSPQPGAAYNKFGAEAQARRCRCGFACNRSNDVPNCTANQFAFCFRVSIFCCGHEVRV